MFHNNSNSLLWVTLIMKTMVRVLIMIVCVYVCGDLMFIP